MQRRQVLAGLGGLASVTALAGCTGGDSSGADGTDTETPTPEPDYEVDEAAPARLELLSVTAPEEITFGQEFEAEVTFVNVGGEPVEDDASLALRLLESSAADPQEAELNSGDLESGEKRSHTIGPFTAAYAGKWAFEAGDSVDKTHDDFDGEVVVSPVENSLGDRQELSENLRLAVDDVQYEQAVHYEVRESPGWGSRTRTSVQGTLDDQVLAVVRATVENTGTRATSLSPDTLAIGDADLFTEIGGYSLTSVQLEGSPLFNTTVNPGQAVDGWALFLVPVDALGDLALELHLDASHSPADVVFDLGGAPELPAFEIDSADVPSQFRDGHQKFEFTITNTGDATGTFRGAVQYTQESEDEEWYHLEGPIEAKIPAGETRTVTHGTDYEGSTTYRYRLKPLGYEFVVEGQ